MRCDGLNLQFDAGRATVMRLADCGVEPADLDALFITHHHSDHLTGLQDLILTRWVLDATDNTRPLPILAPTGPAVRFVENMLDTWSYDLEIRRLHTGRTTWPQVAVRSFEIGEGVEEVWSAEGVSVKAGEVCHQPVRPAVGYRIDTPYGSAAITGDTAVCQEVAALADGCDVLVYEAMRFDLIRALPENTHFILDYHADTRLIGAQARELAVPYLILTHLIPAPTTEEERQGFVDDIRGAGYEGELIVADDLATVTLK